MTSLNSTVVSVGSAINDNTSPLAIFLVKSGSKGNRLMFRYPFEISDGNHNEHNSSTDNHAFNSSRKKHVLNPYLSLLAEDFMNNMPVDPSVKEIVQNDQTNYKASSSSIEHHCLVDPHVYTVISLSDKVLSDLFAVKPTLCGQKFEVKINDIRFVGHPMSLASCTANGDSDYCIKNREKDLLTFNIVFAVRANASHDIVNCYHDCSQRIAIALQFEENRVSYLSKEIKSMLKVHDEHSEVSQELGFKKILESSQLALSIKKVYDDLMSHGTVHMSINRWVNVSFCLPQKVHRLTLRHHDCVPPIGPENIQSCFEHLRPYHGILLLVGTEHLKEILPQDASPAFFRIINVVTPTKNLLELSADADISLQQVFQIVAQLVYWGKATVIYPLCESNVFTVHPLATSSISSEIAQKFFAAFNENLLLLLSDFSLGVTLSQIRSPLQKQTNLISQVKWMLRHRLLLQLHCYVYLVPLTKRPAFRALRTNAENVRPTSCEPGSVDYSSSLTNITSAPENSFSYLRSDDEDSTSPRLTPLEESGTSLLNGLGLNEAEREAILRVPAARNLDDLKLFSRLCPYFNGKRHLEDIIYYENVRRSQLLALIDKFRDVLLTCQYEDSAVAQLCPYNFMSEK